MPEETPLTMESVQKMISEGVAAAMKPLNDSLGKLTNGLAAQSQQADAIGVRRRYIEEKMANVPAIYAEKMPNTSDVGQLAQAEQAIRGQYMTDVKKSGLKVPDVSGAAGGFSASSAPPLSGKSTPSDLVSQALRGQPIPQERK